MGRPCRPKRGAINGELRVKVRNAGIRRVEGPGDRWLPDQCQCWRNYAVRGTCIGQVRRDTSDWLHCGRVSTTRWLGIPHRHSRSLIQKGAAVPPRAEEHRRRPTAPDRRTARKFLVGGPWGARRYRGARARVTTSGLQGEASGPIRAEPVKTYRDTDSTMIIWRRKFAPVTGKRHAAGILFRAVSGGTSLV